RTILEKEPDIMKKSFLGKAGDLTWYRCITDKALPKEEHSLAELPMTKVFNETGIATMHTSLGDIEKNAMLSFRSSPYGSTSHALANQNAFNTFYGGKAIFYSSGHRTGFTDDHCMYSYRNTRAHNSILVNGMTQTIGTEGYGWIPRWYEGEKISYMVGDASNAYGKITAPIWLKRGELSGTQYTPEKGWDENKLKMFRRHIIQLGNTGVYVIYDELEGKEAVTWSYLLHTVELPMEMQELPDEVKVTGKNKDGGISVAHLFSSAKTEQAIVDTFFCAPTNWKNVTNAQGKAVKYPNHWHFSSTTIPCKTARFLTVMDTHGNKRADMKVVRQGNTVQVGDWIITCNLTEKGKAAISVTHQAEKVSLKYDAGKKEGATIITDQVQGKQVNKVLTDYLPDFEI
ncbi:heparinase, partial [Bacteroides thetaiotaomicron]